MGDGTKTPRGTRLRGEGALGNFGLFVVEVEDLVFLNLGNL